MGMAASQARLLSLTSRLHDVELQAQYIEAQKIALATQKDGLYQDYCDALKATAFKVKFQDGTSSNLVDANYESLCKYSEYRDKNYMLIDSKSGRALIDKDMAEVYKQYSNNKYAFAYAMMGVTPDESIIESLNDTKSTGQTAEAEADTSDSDGTTRVTSGSRGRAADGVTIRSTGSTGGSVRLTDNGQVTRSGSSGGTTRTASGGARSGSGNTTTTDSDNSNDDKTNTNPKKTYAQVFTELAEACGKKDAEFDLGEFNYYCQKWEAIQEAGGFKVLDKPYESGEDATKWFKSAVESGEVIIRGYGENGHKNEWSDTSFATSVNGNFLQEVNDKTDEKKAELKYEQELNAINQKDARFDTELSKLESERTALTTERDSIEKIIGDNVEKNFGIFS